MWRPFRTRRVGRHYSLGITLWEMLSGKLPFQGAAVDLMYQHQHATLPIQKLQSVPAPVIALLEILLAKDPGERFQDPVRLQNALIKVKEALASGSRLTTRDLCRGWRSNCKAIAKKRSRKACVSLVAGRLRCFVARLERRSERLAIAEPTTFE
jgi:serine/threonine protein kinase